MPSDTAGDRPDSRDAAGATASAARDGATQPVPVPEPAPETATSAPTTAPASAPTTAAEAAAGSAPAPAASRLEGAVRELRDRVDAATFPVDVPGAQAARAERTSLLAQLDDYVLPRLAAIDAPLLVVVGGSTGSGKSTLVNSIVRDSVTKSGVLRPTTRAPVLVHHAGDRAWFTEKVLPRLGRLTGASPDQGRVDEDMNSVRLVTASTVPQGMALLDAPDIDSVVAANRELSRQLLNAADLWLFVTTAARYADAVPWELLHEAGERGTSVAIVLDRVPPEAMSDIRTHLAQMLADHQLGSAPIFTIPESHLGDDGLLPDADVAPVRDWLTTLAQDAVARQSVVRRTLAGAIDSFGTRVGVLAAASGEQTRATDELTRAARTAHADAVEDVRQGMSDGTLLRGEVLARWQEFVGTGEFLRSVEAGVGRLRDRITARIQGRPMPTEQLGEVLQTGVAALVSAQAERAAADTARAWRSIPGGPALLAADPALARPQPGLEDAVDRLVRDWQGDLLELVRAEGADRRTTARVLAYGVNGLSVVLMLYVFFQTAGITGAEVGIAGGSAVLAQRLLEAVFGENEVRRLAAKARTDLEARVENLYATQAARYEQAVGKVAVPMSQESALAQAAVAVKAAR